MRLRFRGTRCLTSLGKLAPALRASPQRAQIETMAAAAEPAAAAVDPELEPRYLDEEERKPEYYLPLVAGEPKRVSARETGLAESISCPSCFTRTQDGTVARGHCRWP